MGRLRQLFGKISERYESWRYADAIKLTAEMAPAVDKASIHIPDVLELSREGHFAKISLGLGHWVYVARGEQGKGYRLGASNDPEYKQSVVPMEPFKPWTDAQGRPTEFGEIDTASQFFTWLIKAWQASRAGVATAQMQRLQVEEPGR